MNESTPWTTAVRAPPQHDFIVQNTQTEQTSTQSAHGHTYGDAVVRDQASAHFGDSYTSYHIHNTIGGTTPPATTSLNISDALAGILAASTRAIALISMSRNPHPILRSVQQELTGLRIIASSLQRFVMNSSSISSERASLIELEDVVTVMTQLVLSFSELEYVVGSTSLRPRSHGLAFLIPLPRKLATATRLINEVQRHKSTLSIILQIIQCGLAVEAQNRASVLNMRTEHELRNDPVLAERLLRLEAPENGVREPTAIASGPSDSLPSTDKPGSIGHNDGPSQSNTTFSSATFLRHDAGEGSVTSDTFAVIVAQSRVYRRVEHREVDAVSACRSTRSHGWSILSGLTAGQVTCVGVISLPLYDIELIRFQRLTSASQEIGPPAHVTRDLLPPSGPSSDIQESLVHDSIPFEMLPRFKDLVVADPSLQWHLRSPKWRNLYGLSAPVQNSIGACSLRVGCLKLLKDELRKTAPDYPAEICAGPEDDDITLWQAKIEGPKDTPFEGGTFSLRIEYPPEYPFRAPRFTFQTKIYHPNIDDEGNISLDVLGTRYTSALTTLKLLLSISSLLDDPNVDQPLVPEIAYVYRNDKAAYNVIARQWTQIYAT